MILPMEELMNEVVLAIENMAGQVGLLLMRGLIDQEVEEITGQRYAPHCPDRQVPRAHSHILGVTLNAMAFRV